VPEHARIQGWGGGKSDTNRSAQRDIMASRLLASCGMAAEIISSHLGPRQRHFSAQRFELIAELIVLYALIYLFNSISQ
jgi:hypothetical protein